MSGTQQHFGLLLGAAAHSSAMAASRPARQAPVDPRRKLAARSPGAPPFEPAAVGGPGAGQSSGSGTAQLARRARVARSRCSPRDWSPSVIELTPGGGVRGRPPEVARVGGRGPQGGARAAAAVVPALVVRARVGDPRRFEARFAATRRRLVARAPGRARSRRQRNAGVSCASPVRHTRLPACLSDHRPARFTGVCCDVEAPRRFHVRRVALRPARPRGTTAPARRRHDGGLRSAPSRRFGRARRRRRRRTRRGLYSV